MLRELVFSLILTSSLAMAQVQLEFGYYDCIMVGSTCNPPSSVKLNIVVPLANGTRLLIGSAETSNAYGPSSGTHTQIVIDALNGTFAQRVLGGSGNDVPNAAAVDPNGNIWIVGNTDSDDFNLVNPIVAQKTPYRTAGFVIELDLTGAKTLFVTYLGGHQTCALPPKQ
jgi:hypothetical protein